MDLIRGPIGMGHTLGTILEAIRSGCTLGKLPPPRANQVAAGNQPIPSSGGPIMPEFSVGAMRDYLVKFIVADDQVCRMVLPLTECF